MGKDKFLSIVIPAYNEEKRIKQTIIQIEDFLNRKHYEYEIIVVNDGSSDETLNLVKENAARNNRIKILYGEINHGKGYSVKQGVMYAEGNYIYFTDADLSTPIEEIDKFISEIENTSLDVIIGSRSIKGSRVVIHQPIYRELLGKLFSIFVRIWCVSGFIDTQCGAKLFRKDVAKRIFSELKINEFAFDVEILYLSKLYGYKVKEIPIVWMNSRDTKVHAIYDGLRMVLDVIRIRYLH